MIGEDMQVISQEDGGSVMKENSVVLNSAEVDSDDEDIIVKKPTRRKAIAALLDDSDEDEEEDHNTAAVSMATEESGTPEDEEEDDSDKENNPNVLPSRVTKKKSVISDDEDEEDENETEDCDDSTQSTAMRNILKSDLFDAESDSEDENKNQNKNDSDSDSDIDDNMPLVPNKEDNEGKDSQAEDSNDDDEPVQLSAAMMKKLKKGASKKPSKPSSSSKPRVNKDDLQQIHSETQRIVRESAVRVPYHQPKCLGLSVFLARTQQKQQQLNTVLKNSPGCTWKTAPGLALQPKMTTPLSSPPELLKPKSKTIPKSNLKDRITAKLNSSKTPKRGSAAAENSKKDSNTLSQPVLADDELPDIDTNSSKPGEADNSDMPIINTEQINLEIDATQTEKMLEEEESQKDNAKPGQDSGFLSGPSSEEENSLEKKIGDKEMVLSNEVKEAEVSTKEPEATQSQDVDNKISSTPTNSTVDKKSFLTPKLVGLTLDCVTPSLSKGPDDFIDLDDDEEADAAAKRTPQNPGIMNLMTRLMKHSAKRTKKKSKDVEMSVVRKEKGESGKEELMLDKVVVHIDSEEEDEEMKRAEAPGAKLQLLKKKLTAKMRQKREEIRSKKNELEAMDNEDGYLDDGDEEAELTDQSDTDKEEEPEEEEEEMEQDDLDDNEYTETEKTRKESNPFVDDEAVDDDEDDGEEEEMKLELESSDGETETVPEAKDPKQSKKRTLYKTKTMELFDDEAMSESPVGSQEANTEQQAVSNRPFKSLSQPTGDDQASEETSTADLSLPEMDSSSIANEIDNSADSSFDLMGSLISAGQRTGRKQTRSGTPDLYDPSSKSSAATSSTYKLYKSTSAMSEIALPIEDTQDLLQGGSSYPSQKLDSQEYNFHLEDSQTVSQMLDDDGLLKVKSSSKPQARRQLDLDITSQSEGMDEMLGLCSGKFPGDTSSPVLEKKPSLFSIASQKSDDMSELLGLCSGQFTEKKDDDTLQERLRLGESNNEEHEEDMDELLALCSGRFTGKNGTATQMSASEDSQTNDTLICSQPAAAKLNRLESPLFKRSGKRKKAVIEDDDEDDDDFEVVDGNVDSQSTGSFEVNSDDEAAAENGDSDDEGNEEEIFTGFKTKTGKVRNEFVEDEAELSGSEAESDEDLDIAEEDDILEEELGDLEELPSDDELRNQVNRVHLKTMIDSDKRELRLLQEMYLEDGDLHADGTGRARKFRWKNVDEDSQQDMFEKSDEEDNGEEDETEAETKWRMERYEREKFLKEQEQEGAANNDGISKVLKLGNACFKQKPQGNTPVTSHTVSKTSQPTTPVTPVTSSPLTPAPAGSSTPNSGTKSRNVFKVPSHGSFLTRNKATLDKISELTKPVSSNIGGPKDSRGFVFAQLSEEEIVSGKNTRAKKPPPPKRSISAPAQPPSKKQKIEKTSSLPTGSIFNLM